MRTKHKHPVYFYTLNIGFWALIIILSILPVGLGRIGLELYFTPQIEISIVFFLSIYSNIKSPYIFAYGIFIDVIYGQPVGMTSFILLILNRIIYRFKANLSKQNINSIIIYFIYSIIAVTILKHIIFSLYYSSSIVPYYWEILVHLLVNIIFYPLMHLFLYHLLHYTRHEN
ncbi:MAG UNVERIFIED_CONTAM: hypothetical protein LVQ98_07040 [Rickettsiaceae bacterium]|jgi:cell shape-determining protein MreD